MKLRSIILGVVFTLILSSCVVTTPDENISQAIKECRITVECGEILKDEAEFSEDIIKNISEDGIIIKETAKFDDGETAFDILKREITNNKIQIDFEKSPVYNSVYIKGIINIYEGDLGESSGWMFFVNGNLSETDASNYILNEGDDIVFSYVKDYNELFN